MIIVIARGLMLLLFTGKLFDHCSRKLIMCLFYLALAGASGFLFFSFQWNESKGALGTFTAFTLILVILEAGSIICSGETSDKQFFSVSVGTNKAISLIYSCLYLVIGLEKMFLCFCAGSILFLVLFLTCFQETFQKTAYEVAKLYDKDGAQDNFEVFEVSE